ncbi:MAG: hypothetical protein ACRCUV_13765 [Eubacterium aggregans]
MDTTKGKICLNVKISTLSSKGIKEKTIFSAYWASGFQKGGIIMCSSKLKILNPSRDDYGPITIEVDKINESNNDTLFILKE